MFEEAVGLLCVLFVGVPLALTVLYWILAGWFFIGHSAKELMSGNDRTEDRREDSIEDKELQ